MNIKDGGAKISVQFFNKHDLGRGEFNNMAGHNVTRGQSARQPSLRLEQTKMNQYTKGKWEFSNEPGG